MRPIELEANQIRRFYRGGARIAAFRGSSGASDDVPEDWVGSTTTVHGYDRLGLTRLPDGTLLRDAIDADPDAYLGAEHVAAYGSSPELLVKLLDAGERLPLHLHPDDAFAREHLRSARGKTEAWIILDADPGATVHLGFAQALDAAELERLFVEQDVDSLIAAMNCLPAAAGDAFFVPAGLPHVIGAGILLLELQQPSDLSLLLERGAGTEEDACLGLPREVALRAVDAHGWSAAELEQLTSRRDGTFFPAAADAFFRAQRVGAGTLERGFAILVVVAGAGALVVDDGEPLRLRRGSTVLVPHAVTAPRLTGSLAAVRCAPPAPDSPQ